jgi:hypothetical protein
VMFHHFSIMFLWFFHDVPMIFPWCSIIFPWCSYHFPMMFLWFFRDVPSFSHIFPSNAGFLQQNTCHGTMAQALQP